MSADTIAEQSAATDRLIADCLNGDEAAWALIVRQQWRRVFNVAYKFVGKHDETEDLTQDVFLKLFKSLHTFNRRANFQTWLSSVSRNLCIDHYRSVRKERETIDRSVNAADLMPASKDASPLKQLELSYQEIAEQLDLPEGTVKSRINRGRTELARQIRRLEPPDRTPDSRSSRGRAQTGVPE